MRPERLNLVNALASALHDGSSDAAQSVTQKQQRAARVLAKATRDPALAEEDVRRQFDRWVSTADSNEAKTLS